MSRYSTDETVRKVLEGDRDAFEGIIDRYQEDLWQIAACSVRDYGLIQDIVQQTFVKAYFALNRFEPGRDLGRWIKGILRNEVRQQLRRMMREQSRIGAYAEQIALEAAMENTEADDSGTRKRFLEECVGALSRQMQRLLRLRFETARPVDDIARELGRSRMAVYKALSRIRASLRECVERKEQAHAVPS
jgi:RNA polymerase sigma-70 factor (ECF subfamily)